MAVSRWNRFGNTAQLLLSTRSSRWSATSASYGVDWFSATLPGFPTTVPFGSHDFKGTVAGLQVGYNWQWQYLVVGAEASGLLSGLRETRGQQGNPLFDQKYSLDRAAALKAKVGVAWGPMLAYVTGGLAYQQSSYSTILIATGAPFGKAYTDSGWVGVYGLGAEYGLTKNLSLRVEGLRYDMGTIIVSPLKLGDPFRGDNRIERSLDTITVGLNWKF